HEQRGLFCRAAAHQKAPALGKPLFQCCVAFLCPEYGAYRSYASCLLRPDLRFSLLEIEVIHIERLKLPAPHAGVPEQQQNGLVPQSAMPLQTPVDDLKYLLDLVLCCNSRADEVTPRQWDVAGI